MVEFTAIKLNSRSFSKFTYDENLRNCDQVIAKQNMPVFYLASRSESG